MKRYKVIFIKPSRIQGGLTYLAEKEITDPFDSLSIEIKAPAGFVVLSLTEILAPETIERPLSELKILPKS